MCALYGCKASVYASSFRNHFDDVHKLAVNLYDRYVLFALNCLPLTNVNLYDRYGSRLSGSLPLSNSPLSTPRALFALELTLSLYDRPDGVFRCEYWGAVSSYDGVFRVFFGCGTGEGWGL